MDKEKIKSLEQELNKELIISDSKSLQKYSNLHLDFDTTQTQEIEKESYKEVSISFSVDPALHLIKGLEATKEYVAFNIINKDYDRIDYELPLDIHNHYLWLKNNEADNNDKEYIKGFMVARIKWPNLIEDPFCGITNEDLEVQLYGINHTKKVITDIANVIKNQKYDVEFRLVGVEPKDLKIKKNILKKIYNS